MFLHVGNDVLIEYNKIIGVFDMVDTTVAKHIKEKNLFANKKAIYISNQDIKSCILTDEKIYYSNISSSTLKKRSNSVLNMV